MLRISHSFAVMFISFVYEIILNRSKLEETKLKQKLREKPHGVNVIGLAIGQKVTTEDVTKVGIVKNVL